MQERAGREARLQALRQHGRVGALGRAEGGRPPFGGLHVVDRHEGRLAAGGEPHVLRLEVAVDRLAQRVDERPGVVSERHGHARALGNARDMHLDRELDVRTIDRAGDRRRGPIMRRGGERQVAFGA